MVIIITMRDRGKTRRIGAAVSRSSGRAPTWQTLESPPLPPQNGAENIIEHEFDGRTEGGQSSVYLRMFGGRGSQLPQFNCR